MTKAKIKQASAILLIIFIIFVFSLSIFFAVKGNVIASLSALAFNGFFSVILYFLIRFHRYITDNNETKEEDED